MESAEYYSYSHTRCYEIGNSFYFGIKHPWNPEGICDINSAVQFYKLAYEKLQKTLK